MHRWKVVAILSVAAVGAVSLAWSVQALAQPMGQMPASQMNQMMGQQIPMNRPLTRQQMNQGMVQMQRQMAQMNQMMAQMEVTIKTLREQLNKVKPDLLTGQERPFYEYLKIMQSHMETMPPTMQSMQGTMQDMMRMIMQVPRR